MSVVETLSSPSLSMITEKLVRERRTIHDFTQDPIPAEQVRDNMLAAACWAPNHHLTQPWRFYWIGDETREAIARLNATMVAQKKGEAAGEEKYQRWRTIPGWLVVTSAREATMSSGTVKIMSTCCVIHNFSLLLWAQGIGVKWTTGAVTRSEEFYDLTLDRPARRAWLDSFGMESLQKFR